MGQLKLVVDNSQNVITNPVVNHTKPKLRLIINHSPKPRSTFKIPKFSMPTFSPVSLLPNLSLNNQMMVRSVFFGVVIAILLNIVFLQF